MRAKIRIYSLFFRSKSHVNTTSFTRTEKNSGEENKEKALALWRERERMTGDNSRNGEGFRIWKISLYTHWKAIKRTAHMVMSYVAS
jgi:hypothetical protein